LKTPVIFDTKNCVSQFDDLVVYRIGDLTNLRSIQE
jgi:UDP-N-acetyl-D-mannosaminuronic acid dehydrogenase